MNKWISIIIYTLLLAGCTSANSNTKATNNSPHFTDTPRFTAAVSPSPSQTPTPTRNQPTFTATVSPSPTEEPTPTQIQRVYRILQTGIFNTATPTFAASRAITRQSNQTARCVAENTDMVLDQKVLLPDTSVQDKEKYTLEFLNSGGSFQSIKSVYRTVYIGDLTGDGIPELVLPIFQTLFGKLYFFGCKEGKYITLYVLSYNYSPPDIVSVKDMNLDGLPELLVQGLPYHTLAGSVLGYQIVGWNGQSLRSLISQTEFRGMYLLDGLQFEWIHMNGIQRSGEGWQVKDIDNNGTLELLIRGGLAVRGDDLDHGPYREETDVYMWNGSGFVLNSMELEPPQYRFQAVQDGDLYTLFHQYDKALSLYYQAIYNDQLDWWTAERSKNAMYRRIAGEGNPTPTLPAPDIKESPNIAAYAHYRMMLLYALRGQLPNSEMEYKTLESQYREGQPGYIFAQMAKVFWDEYQTSQNISPACGKTVEFASTHQDKVFAYIGGDYHGWQSISYTPEDICPFQK